MVNSALLQFSKEDRTTSIHRKSCMNILLLHASPLLEENRILHNATQMKNPLSMKSVIHNSGFWKLHFLVPLPFPLI